MYECHSVQAASGLEHGRGAATLQLVVLDHLEILGDSIHRTWIEQAAGTRVTDAGRRRTQRVRRRRLRVGRSRRKAEA